MNSMFLLQVSLHSKDMGSLAMARQDRTNRVDTGSSLVVTGNKVSDLFSSVDGFACRIQNTALSASQILGQ